MNYLRELAGEQLKETAVKLEDKQIALEEPKEIKVILWRNDEAVEKRFEIKIQMPWGNIYFLGSSKTKEKALRAYKEIVEALKSGKAKIKIKSPSSVTVGVEVKL